MFLNQTISAIIQFILFMSTPFAWWLITARRRQGFFGWLGWTRVRTDNPRRLIVLGVVTLLAFCAISLLLIPSLAGRTGTSAYSGLGWVAVPPMLVYALFQTSFVEEAFFRGFLLKRIGARFGLTTGNVVQATLFGLAHTVPFMLQGTGLGVGVAIGLFSGVLGYLMGWINERLAGGSLWPSYALHAVGNLFGALLVVVGIV